MAFNLKSRIVALGRGLTRSIEAAEARLNNLMVQVAVVARPSTARDREMRKARVGDLLTALDAQVRQEGPQIMQQAWALGRLASDSEKWTKALNANQEFNQFDAEALRILTDNLVNGLTSAIQTVGRETEDIFRREALRQTVAAYARPEVPGAFQAAPYERRLREQGITGFIDKAGRHWNLSTYAEMHMRTLKAEAANLAMANRMLARGLLLIDIDSHPGACDLCKKWDGKTFALVDGVEGYEKLSMLPPFHPQCTHFGTPSRKSLELQ